MITEESLKAMYLDDGMSIRDIAAETGVDYSRVRSLMKQFGIRARSYSEAEFNFRKTKPELHRARRMAIQKAKTDVFGELFIGKASLFAIIRQAIRPYISIYREEHPICEVCKERSSQEVHHPTPLAVEVNSLYQKGLSLMEIAKEVATLHYTGKVGLVAVCKRCHPPVVGDR